MNAQPAKAWRCERCARMFTNKRAAELCCVCVDCGKDATYGGGIHCPRCLKKSDVAIDEARLLEAKRELSRVKKSPLKGDVRTA